MELHVSIGDLVSFARQFWEYVADAKVFAFHGPMGAGKTTLIGAVCQYKGTKDITASPTFSIINEYYFTDQGQREKIYHIDLYRLRDEAEVVQAGVEDCIYSGSLCFVEWPEKAPGLFDAHAVHVHIEILSDSERKLRISRPS
jgi:tRNA threonylcarbamoyladenosine biosynthesis protein TsaE